MILPSAYFPPVSLFSLLVKTPDAKTEAHEHFIKQSYRNRCEIYGANGKMNLIIPLQKWRNHTGIQDIKISFEENWSVLHWRSIESAYRTSPYFEFYEEDIKPLVFDQSEFLLERNQLITKEIGALIQCDLSQEFTDKFEQQKPDYRQIIHPKNKEPLQGVDYKKYIQVFEDKHRFIPNLSILDLVFNLGPDSKSYLQNLITL